MADGSGALTSPRKSQNTRWLYVCFPPIADIRQLSHQLLMPWWLAFPLMALSASGAVLSFRANKEAARTGRLRFLFWHIRGWGERDRNPWFFKFAQAQNHYRTFFLVLLTIALGAFFLEAIGLIYQ